MGERPSGTNLQGSNWATLRVIRSKYRRSNLRTQMEWIWEGRLGGRLGLEHAARHGGPATRAALRVAQPQRAGSPNPAGCVPTTSRHSAPPRRAGFLHSHSQQALRTNFSLPSRETQQRWRSSAAQHLVAVEVLADEAEPALPGLAWPPRLREVPVEDHVHPLSPQAPSTIRPLGLRATAFMPGRRGGSAPSWCGLLLDPLRGLGALPACK